MQVAPVCHNATDFPRWLAMGSSPAVPLEVYPIVYEVRGGERSARTKPVLEIGQKEGLAIACLLLVAYPTRLVIGIGKPGL